eukprot:scaffold15330_cov103-Cylindrotheca_fusiformis.AAC.1
MRAEYLYCHLHNTTTNLVNGKTTATLAGLSSVLKSPKDILPFILHHDDLAKDMQQHGLHPNMIQAPIQQRCQELEDAYYYYYQTKKITTAQRLGGASSSNSNNAREQMLAAAERRRQQQQQQQQENEEKKS